MAGFKGLGPGFSPWLPLKTELNANKTWVGKFPIDEEVSMWGLRKYCHWEVSIDVLQAYLLNSAGGGLITSATMSTAVAPGVFEYKIIAPDGKVIMWQKIFLTLTNTFLVETGLGVLNIGFYIWTSLDDRSYHFRSRRFASIEDSVMKLSPPIVIAKVDSLDYDTGEAMIQYNGTPLLSPGGEKATIVSVERAKIDDGLLDSKDIPPLDYKSIGNLTHSGTADIWQGTFAQEKGSVFVYRLKIGSSYTDGISLVCFGKSGARSRIVTYVINGYPTLSYPDFSVPSDGRLSYEEYAQWVWFPRNREETMFLDPAAGFDYTDKYGLVDTWWNSPVYQFRIPAGSELHLRRDYFAFPSSAQYRTRNKEWQFSFKTAPSQIWSVIEQVAGNMLQAQVANGDVVVVSGDRPVNGPIASTRSLILFDNGQGAFLYAAKNGTVYCGLIKSDLTQLYISTDTGRTFNPVMAGGWNPVVKTEDDLAKESKETAAETNARIQNEKLTYDNQAVFLFNREAGYKVLDMYKDEQSKIYILAEKGDYLYVQINPEVVGGYGNVFFVNKKAPNNIYKFVDYTDKSGDKSMIIAGSTSSFISTDGGRSWGYPEGYGEDDYVADNRFDDATVSVTDGYKDNTGNQYTLGEQNNNLVLEIRDGSTEPKKVIVGPKKADNTYTMPHYSTKHNDGTMAIYGKNHRYVSSNGGHSWEDQQIVEE